MKHIALAHITRIFFGLLMACTLWLAGSQSAQAQDVVCSNFNMPGSINFGSFTPFDSAPATSGQLSFECYNTNSGLFGIGTSIYAAACFNYGLGSAGGSAISRNMTNTGATTGGQLQYQIYRGANATWGSRAVTSTTAAEVVLELPVKCIFCDYIRRTGLINYTANVAASQQYVLPGDYQSNFSGTNAEIVIVTSNNPNVTCQGTGASSSNVSFTPKTLAFSVNAKVLPMCNLDVAGSLMNFGSIDPLSAGPFDASTNIRTRCTNKTNYQIALEPSGTPTPTSGVGTLRSSFTVASNPDTYLTYGLFKDTARTQPWGNIQNGNTVSRQGTGDFESSIPVYGRITNGNVRPGNYSDTVVVKITY